MDNSDLKEEIRKKNEEIEKLRREVSKYKDREQKSFHENLISDLPGMAFYLTLKDKWTLDYVSEGCRYLTGFDPEELTGDREAVIDMITVEEDRQRVRTEINKAVKTNHTYYLEYRIVTKTGQLKFVSEKGRGIFDASGKLTAISGFLADISRHKFKEIEIEKNRKQLQEMIFNRSKELAESEQKHRILVESLKDGVFILQDSNVIFASNAFKEIAGYEKDDLLGKDFRKFTTNEAGAKMAQMNKRRLNGEEVPSIYETTFIKKNGLVIPVELNVGLIQYQGSLATIGVIRDISERKIMEQALISSEQRLSYAMEAMNDGLWDWDLAEDRYYFNDRYFEMAGYSKDEVTDGNLWFRKNVHLDDREELNKKIEDLISGNSTHYQNMFRLKTKNGDWIWVESTAKVVEYDSLKLPSRIVGIHSDVTQRKNALEQVKTNLALLESFIDTIPSPVFYKTIDGQYLHCNKRFAEILHTNKDEVIGKYTSDLLPIIASDTHIEADNQLLKTRNPQLYEVDHIYPDGSEKSFIAHKNLFYDSDNQPKGIIGVLVDITARKKIETDLKKNQRFLSSLLDKLPVILWCIDHKGIFTLGEGEGLKVLGLKPNQLVGVSVFDFYMSSEIVKSHINRALGGEQFSATVLYGELAYETYYIPLRDNDNNIEGVMGVSLDTTKRHKAQEEVRRYIEDIQESRDLVERNAFELAKMNYQLEQSEVKLKELNASKDRFFSIISHDLRSPFTSILGLAEIAVEDIAPSLSEEDAEIILALNNSAKNVYTLLENLLEWSRLQLDRIEFEPKATQLCFIIRSVFELFKEKARQKKITFSNKVDESVEVFADENMLETIIRNLVSNALKFTADNGTIEISCSADDKCTELSVADNGIGMSAIDVERLFKIDEQHSTNGLAGETGTGLGLILCKELVEKNNGTIDVESSPGYGTKFTLKFPVK